MSDNTTSTDIGSLHVQPDPSHLRNTSPIAGGMPPLLQSQIDEHDKIGQHIRPVTDYREIPSSRHLERIAVRCGEKLVLVHLREVLWIQSKGNFLCLHLVGSDCDCRMTMKDLTGMLDSSCFLRIHRNAIVNLDYVVEFDLPRYGNAFVHLCNGKALPISRTGRAALRRTVLSRSYFSGVENRSLEG